MDVSQFNTSMQFVRDCVTNATVHEGLLALANNHSALDAYLTANNLN